MIYRRRAKNSFDSVRKCVTPQIKILYSTMTMTTMMIRTALLASFVALATGQKVQAERHFTDCDAECGGGSRREPSLGIRKWTLVCNSFDCDLAPPEGCSCAGADIIFIVDRSYSIREPNYWKIKQFMMDFANAFDMVLDDSIDRGLVRFAAVTFDAYAQTQFDFDAGLSLKTHDALMDTLWGMKFEPPALGTNTPAGLFLATEILHDQGKADSSQIAFILTDGNPTKRDTLAASIEAIHSDHHSVYALGIGHGVNEKTINSFVNNKEGHAFVIRDFTALPAVLKEILDAFCCKTVKKDCTKDAGPCEPNCGHGNQTVSGVCVLSHPDGEEISSEPFEYEQACCNDCPAVTNYCHTNPCSSGNCTDVEGGFECDFPPAAQC